MKIILTLWLLITSALAVPEKDLEQVWDTTVYPHFASLTRGAFASISGGKKVAYFYKVSKENTKTILIVPGRSEPAVKYAELIYDLKDLKVNIFIMDHIGQGESERLLSDPQKGYIKKFTDYVNNLGYFNKAIIRNKTKTPVYLIAHSMGAAVSTISMSYGMSGFKKAVLLAPMFQLNTSPYSERVARYYSKLLVTIGKGIEYAPGKGPYIPEDDTFEMNTVTSSEARFNISKKIFTTWPHLTVAGPTTRWVQESLKATKKIHHLNIRTPVLLFQAGKDEIVRPGRQNAFCRPSFCELIAFPDAKHEILMENDEIRDEALVAITSFFEI